MSSLVADGRRSLRTRLAAGEVLWGISCVTGSVHAVEVFATAGVDYVFIDLQHGLGTGDVLADQLRAVAGTDTAALVRVGAGDTVAIGRALDFGADGVIVPLVESEADARRASAACRYPPDGNRSFGPVRARLRAPTDPMTANERVYCVALVETVRGVANAQAIAATPGIDAIYVGWADLALSMGLVPQQPTDGSPLAVAMEKIRQASVAAGKPCAMSVRWTEAIPSGFQLVTVGSDNEFLAAGARAVALGGPGSQEPV